MKGKHFRRPSPAMVIASLALIVALGGTSYAAIKLPANSVGTKQLKKNAVTGAKVKNGSLLAGDFKSGQLPAGPRGPQGVQGPQGAQGPPGPARVPTVTVRSSGAEEPDTATADCNAGEAALGGGGTSSDGLIWDTGPKEATGTPTGWTAQAVQGDGTSSAMVQAWVVCGAP